MEKESYLCVAKEAQTETVINRSRFITFVRPVQTEEEAKAFLRARREAMPDATHHCSAYVVGDAQQIQRFDDDGEPGGTAGMPILDVLLKKGLTNLAVVVTRYFGGILLGAGGLTRAYSGSCASVIREAGISKWEKSAQLLCEVPYTQWGKVQNRLGSFPCIMGDVSYAEAVSLTVLTRRADVDAFCALLRNITDGRAEVCPMDEIYYTWEEPTYA